MADPKQLKDEQRRDWDAAAAGWKKWWPLFERSAQHVSDRLVELAGVGIGARVLDIATGNGEPALTAARRVGPGGRVIATDQSVGMLTIARERAAALGVANVEFREIDGESLAIPESDFDAVLCRWGLMFMPDVKGALIGIHQRLRAGGRLATSVWATADKCRHRGGEENRRAAATTARRARSAATRRRIDDARYAVDGRFQRRHRGTYSGRFRTRIGGRFRTISRRYRCSVSRVAGASDTRETGPDDRSGRRGRTSIRRQRRSRKDRQRDDLLRCDALREGKRESRQRV